MRSNQSETTFSPQYFGRNLYSMFLKDVFILLPLNSPQERINIIH